MPMPAFPWSANSSLWICSSIPLDSSKTQWPKREYSNSKSQCSKEWGKGLKLKRMKVFARLLHSSSSTWKKRNWLISKDSLLCWTALDADSLTRSVRLYSTSTAKEATFWAMKTSVACFSIWVLEWRTIWTLYSSWQGVRKASSQPTEWQRNYIDHTFHMINQSISFSELLLVEL